MFLVFHNLQGNYLTIYLPIQSIIWLERYLQTWKSTIYIYLFIYLSIYLSIQAIIWLERYLQTWKSTILVVSHDRSFLDEVPTDILHLHSQKIDTYKVGGTQTRQLTRQEEQQPDNLQGRRNTNQTTYKVGETPTRQLTRQEEQQPDNLQGMRNNNQTNYKVGGTTTRQITRQEEQQPDNCRINVAGVFFFTQKLYMRIFSLNGGK